MEDSSNNGGGTTGGLVKKLLFPASSSGANAAFRHPNNDANANTVVAVPRSPRRSPPPPSLGYSTQNYSHHLQQQQQPQGHQHHHRSHSHSSSHGHNNKMNFHHSALAAAAAASSNNKQQPLRFFSSTHPSSSSSAVENIKASTTTTTTTTTMNAAASQYNYLFDNDISSSSSHHHHRRGTNIASSVSPQQQPLQTPARVPSSPPLLNRQPVTPSSEMATKTGTDNTANVHANTGDLRTTMGVGNASNSSSHQRKLYTHTSSMSVEVSHAETTVVPQNPSVKQEDELVQYATAQGGSPMTTSPNRTKHVKRGRNTSTNTTTSISYNNVTKTVYGVAANDKDVRLAHHHPPYSSTRTPASASNTMTTKTMIEEEEDDSLYFLKQFKSNRHHQNSYTTSSSRDLEDEAKTEVHDNTTTAQHERYQQEQHRHRHQQPQQQQQQLVASTANFERQDIEYARKSRDQAPPERQESDLETPSNNDGTSTKNRTEHEDDNDDDIEKSPHDIQSYPSYYDDPYHNPLVASALKPQIIYFGNNDNSMESDVNSNASEMGTIIGAPMSLLADRFAEVDEMEREGKLSMENDDDANPAAGSEVHSSSHLQDDDNILDEEDDPALITNYKAFRANDDDNDDKNLSNSEDGEEPSFLKDPFLTPPAAHTFTRAEPNHVPAPPSEIDSTASQMGTVVGTTRLDEVQAMMATTLHKPGIGIGDDSDGGTKIRQRQQQQQPHAHPTMLGQLSPKELRKRDENGSPPIGEPREVAFSVVDSEIEELVRRTASESSGTGIVKTCSSNNSAEVFRAPSTGSMGEKILGAKPPIGNLSHLKSLDDPYEREDSEVQTINGANSRDSSALSSGLKKRPDSSLQRALNRVQQKQQENEQEDESEDHNQPKEDEKEEKEDDLLEQQDQQKRLQQYRFEVPKEEEGGDYGEFNEMFTAVDSSHHASTGSPSAVLASTIRRIGTKLARRSPKRGSNDAAVHNQYFFDIDGDENSDGDNDNYFKKSSDGTASAPTTPRQTHADRKQQQYDHHSSSQYSLTKIQEAFPQSPDRSSTANSHSHAPASFLLRSPGSTARLMADFRRESSSSSLSGGNDNSDSQRFSAWNRRVPSILQSVSSTSLGEKPTPRATGGGRNAEGQDSFQPTRMDRFRSIRGCLSLDTTADNHYEYDHRRETDLFQTMPNGKPSIRSTQSFDVRHPRQSSSSSSPASAFRSQKSSDENGTTQALYGSSRSWDISSGMASSMWSASAGAGESLKDHDDNSGLQPGTIDARAFRLAPYARHQQEQQHPHPHAHGYNNSNGSRLVSGERQERIRLMSETSVPAGHHITGTSRQHSDFELLQTPQRIEIEREDALNLLACLCERGVALHSQEGESNGMASPSSPSKTEGRACDLEDHCNDKKFSAATERLGEVSPRKNSVVDLEPETIDAAVEVLRDISKYHINGHSLPHSPDHDLRMYVLDELIRSHTYALEMKRAALSASAWLRSIGHSDYKVGDSDNGIFQEQRSVGFQSATEAGQAAGEREASRKSDSAENANIIMIELLAVKAMLHQAQMEAREKDEAARRLNEELSKCRAEIGRLKSASRSKSSSFTSPNRSILDDEDDDESANSITNKNGNTRGATFLARKDSDNKIGDESMVDLDSSLFANEETAEIVRESDQPMVRELAKFKSALSDANAIIKKLHSELKEATPNNEDVAREAPVIEVTEMAFSVALVDESTSNVETSPTKSFSDQHPDNRTVNVRMLNGENFVTEWQTVESLPPPPDHGLRSPIVDALLQQWSPDEGLHESLLSWVDRAISGDDPSTIPPLALSGLDHQVRDGFTMHVLPLLLRRSDILVDVKTRAHRQTTYDIAVSVKRNARSSGGLRHMESTPDSASGIGSVSHSAVTALVHNGYATANDHYEVGSTAASYSSNYSTLLPHRSSDDRSESGQQQAGLMTSALGALGGLLSRRKPNTSYFDAGIMAAASSYDLGSAVGAAGSGPMDFAEYRTADAAQHERQDEPYHRLVSAPPGRIGVSFVEYRGHAMVANVSQDSPLYGWIFESDILIAIDEVPVSGMRLKEIVKVLQGRSERQRALRVISSHAMNELTMSAASTPS